ncbi:MAG: hypothetical protein ACR5LF_05915 [Symbiopectobacterium sp.]
MFSNWKVDSTIYTYTTIALTLLLIMSSMGALMLKQIKINEKTNWI